MKWGSRQGVLLRAALGAAVVSSVVVGGPARAYCRETVYVDVYEVEVTPERDRYRIGDTAVIEGRVTRTDTGAPVAAADFVVYIPPTRKGFVYTWGKTDAQGHAVVKMKLKRRDVETGPAKIVGRAYQERADATCAQVVEFGETHVPRAFVIEE